MIAISQASLKQQTIHSFSTILAQKLKTCKHAFFLFYPKESPQILKFFYSPLVGCIFGVLLSLHEHSGVSMTHSCPELVNLAVENTGVDL